MTDLAPTLSSSPIAGHPLSLDPALFMSLAPDSSRLFSLMNPVFIAGQGLTAQFIGANPGEGVSTIARDFALTAARYMDSAVLLLDFDWGQDSHFVHFQQVLKQHGCAADLKQTLNLEIDLSPLLGVPGQPETSFPLTFHRLPGTRLILGRPSAHLRELHGQTPCILNRPDIWSLLRRQFMLTVVDSPPASQSFDGIAISSGMDAVVLVVRAESTRTPVVENLRDRLVAHGAPLVGVVLNKRRFYIPKRIYRFLERL